MSIRITGLQSGLDIESLVSASTQKYQNKIDTITKKQKTNELKMTTWNALNSKIYSFYTGSLSALKYSNNYSKTTSKSSSDALTVEGNNTTATQTVKILDMASTAYLTSAKVDENINKDTKLTSLGFNEDTYKFNGVDINITKDDTISTLMTKLNSTGINSSFDDSQKRFYFSAKQSGKDNDFNLSDNTSTELLNILGISNQAYVKDGKYYSDENYQNLLSDQTSNVAVKVSGKDASVLINGVNYTGSTNTFKINDMTYTINKPTNEDIIVSSKTDTSAIYDSIKTFLTEYNSIINEMTKSYNTSNKGYTPLTESQKDKMSDSEIEKWEQILEDSSLYKDSRLNSVINSIKSVMQQGIKMSDGTTMYLSSFGISTGNYFTTASTERNAYHIDGDKTDSTVTNKTNKLLEMIETDPKKVEEFFTTLSKNLYNKLTDEMKSTEYSSMYKIYNDKQLSSQQKTYEKQLEEWQKKLSEMEDKYYNQYSNMETILANMNSQINALNQLFNF